MPLNTDAACYVVGMVAVHPTIACGLQVTWIRRVFARDVPRAVDLMRELLGDRGWRVLATCTGGPVSGLSDLHALDRATDFLSLDDAQGAILHTPRRDASAEQRRLIEDVREALTS